MYVFVRTNLPPIQQAVQASHSALELCRQGLVPSSYDHPSLVLCGMQDEASLLAHADYLQSHGIGHILFREPDLNNEATAIATVPLSAKQRRLFRKANLLTL